jgi:predicted esterase
MSDPLEHHLAVARTARFYTLGARGPHVGQVWIVCHGYGQLASRFVRRFQPLDNGTRCIVAPEALNRFYVEERIGPHSAESRVGATWMTREDRLHEIRDYLAYLDRLHDHIFAEVPRAAVTLVGLGFSQGVATLTRWASRNVARVDHLVLWAGTLPPELELRPDLFGGARVTLVVGNTDPLAGTESAHSQQARLHQAGIRFDTLTFDGGHEINEAALLRLAGAGRPHGA